MQYSLFHDAPYETIWAWWRRKAVGRQRVTHLLNELVNPTVFVVTFEQMMQFENLS